MCVSVVVFQSVYPQNVASATIHLAQVLLDHIGLQMDQVSSSRFGEDAPARTEYKLIFCLWPFRMKLAPCELECRLLGALMASHAPYDSQVHSDLF